MIELNDQRYLEAALREDFGTFIAKVFSTVSPGDIYRHNWHVDAIAHELLRVHRGELDRLIMNQPPRSLKSICTSVAFVAWSLGHDPSRRFACCSYSHELAATFARQFRSVIASDWYRRLFPSVRLVKDSEVECITTRGGGRAAIPVGGSLTGRGADVIILDDVMKAEEAQSEKSRRAVIDWFTTTLLSRLDDKKTGSIILVMQRLHEDDLAGKLLVEGGWHHLNLPAIAQEDEDIAIGPAVNYRRRKGDVLHPEREPAEVLERIKREIGSLTFSAQYLQAPVPMEGNLIKRSWIVWYDALPNSSDGTIVQSWDVASTLSLAGDYSVCTTWLVIKRDYFLIDVWRGRVEFPQLRRKLVALSREHQPHRILVEHAPIGLQLIQDLRASAFTGVPVPQGIKPKGDKLVRMEAQCARFENGQVHLPRNVPWLAEFLGEILAFPNGRYDDQVDSTSQFLNWAERDSFEYLWVGAGAKFFMGGQEWHPGGYDSDR
jgi:predicted phage terminase large subunit-like protein